MASGCPESRFFSQYLMSRPGNLSIKSGDAPGVTQGQVSNKKTRFDNLADGSLLLRGARKTPKRVRVALAGFVERSAI